MGAQVRRRVALLVDDPGRAGRVSAVAAWWWLEEGMSVGQLVGGAIVLGALAVIVVRHRGLDQAEDVPEPI